MRAHGTRDHAGQSLTEFALVLPIFLLLIVGVFDIGRYVIAQAALANAAREGARLAVVNQTSSEILARVQGMAFLSSPTVQTPLFLVTAPALNDSNFNDNAQCAPLAVNCVAVVQATADLNPITPIVSSVLGPITLRAVAMQPIEFVCPNPGIPGFTTPESCPKQAP